jgi:hypothetical protein
MNRFVFTLLRIWLVECVSTIVYYCASDTMRQLWTREERGFKTRMEEAESLWWPKISDRRDR